MGYRDILVYLDGAPGHATQMRCALNIAKNHQATIQCLYLKPDYALPVVLAAPIDSELVGRLMSDAQTRMESIKSHCVQLANDAGMSINWIVNSEAGVKTLSHYMRGVDLVVVSQHAYLDPFEPGYCSTANVLTHAPVPVLVVPDEIGNGKKPVNNILLAWNGSREGTRAIHDALPLLKRSTNNTLMVVMKQPQSCDHITINRLVSHLSRHGVTVNVEMVSKVKNAVGAIIRQKCASINADLIVMGAYGHSRFTQTVFGGVTQDILHNARCPALMSH